MSKKRNATKPRFFAVNGDIILNADHVLKIELGEMAMTITLDNGERIEVRPCEVSYDFVKQLLDLLG